MVKSMLNLNQWMDNQRIHHPLSNGGREMYNIVQCCMYSEHFAQIKKQKLRPQLSLTRCPKSQVTASKAPAALSGATVTPAPCYSDSPLPSVDNSGQGAQDPKRCPFTLSIHDAAFPIGCAAPPSLLSSPLPGPLRTVLYSTLYSTVHSASVSDFSPRIASFRKRGCE